MINPANVNQANKIRVAFDFADGHTEVETFEAPLVQFRHAMDEYNWIHFPDHSINLRYVTEVKILEVDA